MKHKKVLDEYKKDAIMSVKHGYVLDKHVKKQVREERKWLQAD